jgi:hypothetical protein
MFSRLLGTSVDDIKQEMAIFFEDAARKLAEAIDAATDKGPHRCVWCS